MLRQDLFTLIPNDFHVNPRPVFFHPSVFSLLTWVTIPMTECIRVKQVERSTNLFPDVWTTSWSRAVKLISELQVAFFVVVSIVIKEYGL